ncbi:MAG: hypothetical protein JSU74_09895 [Candidatus Zixiibacteriota bacterium]|nr:MAG: hypothetical protein JSU74_09895 [candidate division Zixibacteria bacterium]
MRNKVLFLMVIVLLYLVPSLILQGIYGPSYGFMSGEDYWQPDGEGGWVKHGQPSSPPPDEPSVNVPMWVRYIPIFLPGLVLFLFLFTPLSRHLESPPKKEEAEAVEGADAEVDAGTGEEQNP